GGGRGAAGGRRADPRPAGRQARRVDRKRRQREPRAAPCRAQLVTVFVTGGGRGFVAGHVVRALERAGHEVRHGWVDVRDADGLERAGLGCDAVMHVAALYSFTAPAAEFEAINVNGTVNVIAACRAGGVRRLVHTSSAGTCGPVAGRPATEDDQPPDWELGVPYK